MAVISVESLTYRYPTATHAALRDVCFTVEAGELVAIVGASGSGKSTLCHALCGYIPHFYHGSLSGEVHVLGRKTATTPLPELVTRIGLVFQNSTTQMSGARFTVAEEVAFGLENLGVPAPEIGARVEKALALAGVAHLAERSPLALSGGQQQRVALAAMMAMNLPVLVLDEPTAQLDPAGSADVFSLLQSLCRRGMTQLVATHDLEWAATYAARILLLHEGALIAAGLPQDVLARPDLAELGLRPLRYTEAARQACDEGLFPTGSSLPVSLLEAITAFGGTLADTD